MPVSVGPLTAFSLAPTAPLSATFVVTFIAGLLVVLGGSGLVAIRFIQGQGQPRWVG